MPRWKRIERFYDRQSSGTSHGSIDEATCGFKLSRQKRVAADSPSILLFLALVAIVMPPRGTNAQDSAVEHEFLLKADREPEISPLVAVATDDNHFIIAGQATATRSGWATKLDANGGAIWTYTIGLLPEDVGAFHGSFVPRFTGAVGMPDGTTFLCGSMPRPPAEYAPGLLVHLDTAGHVLSQQLIIPRQRNAHGIARFADCIRWGNGIAIVGNVLHVVRAGEEGAPFPQGLNYWALTLDNDAKIEREWQVRASLRSNIPKVGPLVVAPGNESKLVFGATDNIATELVGLSAATGLEVVKKLAGQFILVRPVTSDGLLQIFGAFPTQAANVTVTLGNQFEELSRATGSHPVNFSVNIAYRLPDRALAIFGSVVHADGAYTSRIARVAPDLQSEQDVDLNREVIADDGSIWAAAPVGKSGKFVVATSAVAGRLYPNHPELSDTLKNFSRGAAVDFVRFK
jgi:hypothetical protein